MSIRSKLTSIFIVLATIPMILIGSILFSDAKKSLKQATLNGLSSMTEAKEGEIFLFFEQKKERMQDFSSDGFIRVSVEKINDGGGDIIAIAKELTDHLIKNKKPLDEHLVAIDVLDLEGTVVASSKNDRIGMDQSAEKSFIKGKEKLYIGEVYKNSDGSIGQEFSHPLKTIQHPLKTIGVLVHYYDASMINTLMKGDLALQFGALTQELNIGKTGESYLVNEDRVMITDSLFVPNAIFNQPVNTYPVNTCFEENREVSGTWKNYRGEPVVGSSMCISIGSFTWVFISEQSETEAFFTADRFKIKVLLVGMAVFIFVVGATLSMAGTISSPIEKLTHMAQRIAVGELHFRVPVTSSDEIGTLAGTFNMMGDKLETVIDGLHKENNERKKTEEKITQVAEALKKANEQLQETTVELIQSEKLAALGELSASIVHELTQPLTTMKIFGEMLEEKIETDHVDKEELQKELTGIVRQLNRMIDIVHHMRVFSRSEKEQTTEMVDLNGVVEGIFLFVSQQLKQDNIEVVKDLFPDLPKMRGHSVSLEQVCVNLLTNARHALQQSDKKQKRILIKTYVGEEKNKVCLEVTDNGNGVPEELQEKIFYAFVTTKEKDKGTGLGLSISKKIIEKHKGTIDLKSIPGEGATFRVVFPANS